MTVLIPLYGIHLYKFFLYSINIAYCIKGVYETTITILR